LFGNIFNINIFLLYEKYQKNIFSLQITLVYSASVSLADNGFDFLSNVESEVKNLSIRIARDIFLIICVLIMVSISI
jgi:hypothetical protein